MEEQKLDFYNFNWFRNKFEIEVFKLFGRYQPKPRFIKDYHTSKHVSKNDLRQITEGIKSNVITPTHTNNEFKEINKVFRNGESIEFN